MGGIGVGERQPVDRDLPFLRAGRDVEFLAAGVECDPGHVGAIGSGQPRIGKPRLCLAAAGRHPPDHRGGPVAHVEVAVAPEDGEPGHVGERGVRTGRDRGVDLLRTRARVDADDPAVHVGRVDTALGIEGHSQETHGLDRGLPGHLDRVGPESGRLAAVEVEGPDLVAGVEGSVEVCVGGVDVQGAAGHGEPTRMPRIGECREHLDVADGAFRRLGHAGSRGHQYGDGDGYKSRAHEESSLSGASPVRQAAPDLEALETV